MFLPRPGCRRGWIDIRERDLLKDKAEQVQRERGEESKFQWKRLVTLYLEKVSLAVAVVGSESSHPGQGLQTHHTRGAATDQKKI